MTRLRGFIGVLLLMLLALARAGQAEAATSPLRVCADPDNLPFSHQDGSGFENRIARLLAKDMGVPLQYEWLPDRRGFVRKTLGARLCDVIIGVPLEFERVLATRAYYRSSFVFIDRADATQGPISSFDDPRLTRRRIGIQLIGNDLAASPPGHALAQHGAIDNVVGFTLAGTTPPAARLVAAVAGGQLDAALLWGPQAGYYIQRAPVPLRLTRAVPPADLAMPFEFSIAMGVRRDDRELQGRLNDFIVRRQQEIDRILADYGVPVLAMEQPR